MKKITIRSSASFHIIMLGAFLCVLGMPAATHAAVSKPTCTLAVSTPAGETEIKRRGDAYLHVGDALQLTWTSKDATTATKKSGQSIALSGTRTVSPKKDTSYTYIFRSSAGTATCSVRVHMVAASFTARTLNSASHTPTLTGTASGTKSIQLSIRKPGEAKKIFVSKTAKVTRGKWSVRVEKKLPFDTYEVTLSGAKNFALSAIRKETLQLGKSVQSHSSPTTLEVSWIPLLAGGKAEAGTSIPVAYLQMNNIGNASTTLQGFTVTQRGSAPGAAIIGLTTVDDTGSLRGYVGGAEGTTPFKNMQAFVPTAKTVFAPGQMRLFTIKASLTKNILPYIGKDLKVDVTSISTDGSIKGPLPLRGTTWTIAY